MFGFGLGLRVRRYRSRKDASEGVESLKVGGGVEFGDVDHEGAVRVALEEGLIELSGEGARVDRLDLKITPLSKGSTDEI